jgi:AcrR family transcriptional regulator
VDQNVETLPRQKRITRSRGALLEALLELLREKPFDRVTVKEITDAANVGYATFFRHYVDKEQLLHDLAAGEISKLLTMTLPLLYSVEPRPSTQALCAYVWDNRILWSALLTGGAAAILKDEFSRQAEEIAARHADLPSRLPGDLAVVFSVSAAIEIIAWWLKQAKPVPVAEMAELMEGLVVQPCMGHWRD